MKFTFKKKNTEFALSISTTLILIIAALLHLI